MKLIDAAQRARQNQRPAELTARFFKKHVAEHQRLETVRGPVELLRWSEPGTNIHRIDYMSVGGRLIVTGDLYDAVYVSGVRSLASWSRCDIQYFAGKCQASPYGRQYRDWDADHAWRYVRSAIADRVPEYETIRADWREHDGYRALNDEASWGDFLQINGEEIFGDDYWQYADAGNAISWECEAHLAGLKAAVDSLGLVDE